MATKAEVAQKLLNEIDGLVDKADQIGPRNMALAGHLTAVKELSEALTNVAPYLDEQSGSAYEDHGVRSAGPEA